ACAARITRGSVVPPGSAFRLEQVGQRWMFKARIDRGVGGFAAGRIDQLNGGSRRRVASRVGRAAGAWILRGKQVAPRRRSRSPGNNELMRRQAGPLVRLEHAVGEGVLFGQLQVGLYIRRVDVSKRALRHTRGARNR